MTFLEGHLLQQAYWAQQARQDRPLAWLVQILLNVHRGEHVTAFELDQVMEALGHAVPPPPAPATPEQLATTFALLQDVFTPGRNGKG